MANVINDAHDALIALLEENKVAPQDTWTSTAWPLYGVSRGHRNLKPDVPSLIVFRNGNIATSWVRAPREFQWAIPFRVVYVHRSLDPISLEEDVDERISDVSEHLIKNYTINNNYPHGSEVSAVSPSTEFADAGGNVYLGAYVDLIIRARKSFSSVS